VKCRDKVANNGFSTISRGIFLFCTEYWTQQKWMAQMRYSGSDSELENTVRKWFQWKKQTIGVKCGAQSTQTSPFSSFLRCSCNSSLTFSTWIKMGVQVICVILRLKLNQHSPQNHFRRKCIIMHHHTIKLKPSRQNTTQSFGIAKIASAQLCLTLGSLTVSYMWLWMAFWQSAHNR